MVGVPTLKLALPRLCSRIIGFQLAAGQQLGGVCNSLDWFEFNGGSHEKLRVSDLKPPT
jgi:hypothetical protein